MQEKVNFETEYSHIVDELSGLNSIADRVLWLMGRSTNEKRDLDNLKLYEKAPNGVLYMTKKKLSELLFISESTAGRRLEDSNFSAEQVKTISEYFGVPVSLLTQGQLDSEIRDYKILGLTHRSSKWLIQHKGTAEHEMLNLILSDEDTANTLLSALCLYVQNPTLKISIENADGYADIPNTILDNHGVLRDVIVDALFQVVENVASLSQKKSANKKA